MEVILIKDVPNLGLKNDVVTVKNGYGENYLIPQGFAIMATPSSHCFLRVLYSEEARLCLTFELNRTI